MGGGQVSVSKGKFGEILLSLKRRKFSGSGSGFLSCVGIFKPHDIWYKRRVSDKKKLANRPVKLNKRDIK